MQHVALIGDSVFDNGTYIHGGPNVGAQLQEELGQDWVVAMLAIDGSLTHEVGKQLRHLSTGVTHIVLSTGGNDALNQLWLFDVASQSVGHALTELAAVAEDFRDSYKSLLRAIGDCNVPTTVCTIYDPNGLEPLQRQIPAQAALILFNNVIITEALDAGFDVLDIRRLFIDAEDYANPIEPSVAGGTKLARAISGIVTGASQQSVSLWG
jgi:hypothetical protein